jgi:hypothetical protein
MKRSIYVWQFVLFAFCPLLCFSQRSINVAPGVVSQAPNPVPYNGSLYFLNGNLFHFDGSATITHPLPSAGGSPLVAGTEPPTAFNSKLYVSCSNGSGNYVYSYDGTVFVNVPLGPVVSNTVVYNGRLWVLRMTGTTMEVVAYDGSVTTVVRSEAVVAGTDHFKLLVSGGSLFVLYSNDDFLAHVLRYNGTAWASLPDLQRFNVAEIITMPGSTDVMFYVPDYVSYLYYYHGGVITRVPEAPLDGFSTYTGRFSWNGAFYFQENYEDEMTYILKYENGVFQGIVPIPDGAYAHYRAEPVIFNNEMYIVTRKPSPDFGVAIYKYDGTTVTHFIDLPAVNSREPWLGVRDGKLIIISDTWNYNNVAYEYDGVSLTSITAPAGRVIRRYWGAADCFYGWVIGDPFPNNLVQFGAEVKSSCLPPPPYPMPFGRLEEFDLSAYAQGRDWCWTGVSGNWVNPNCLFPPFCQDPAEFQVSMIGLFGRVAYRDEFDKPFTTNFGLSDKLPYTMTVGMKSGNSFENVVALGPGLVTRGVESISLKVISKDRSFRFTVTTDKNKSVPLTLTLLNAKGKIVYSENVVAPVDKYINGKPSEPGMLLLVTGSITLPKQFQEYGIESIASYPNPTAGKITIDIQRSEDSDVKVAAVVHDLYGNKIWSGLVSDDQLSQIDLTGRRPGLYILTITAGEASERRVIQLK